METTYADSWSDSTHPCDMDMWVMKWRSAWPIFHSPVILPCILKTIWCMYIILWECESVWPDVSPQNYCRSLWPIFHGPVILSYILKTVWCMNIIIWDYETVWPIFHGPVILRYILKTIWGMYIILWDYGSVWPQVWPHNTCRSKWPIFHGPVICLISPRLFGAWVSYFQILRQCDPNFDLKVNISQHDLYFMV